VTDAVVVLITFSNENEAAEIAGEIVNAGLAGCANIIRNVRSIYRWQGKVQDENEVLMVLKTQTGLFSALEAKVKELHSYAVPEIIALPVVEGSEKYLDWLRQETGEAAS
jgi:periplasmic divalent cation tolerance protein